jgi:hypothetical protein
VVVLGEQGGSAGMQHQASVGWMDTAVTAAQGIHAHTLQFACQHVRCRTLCWC